MLEGVLILRNSSHKLKMVVDNANLQHYAVSSENSRTADIYLSAFIRKRKSRIEIHLVDAILH